MTTNIVKLVHSLIIDTGPIIKNTPSIPTLLSIAEAVYTIPSVIQEIRDESTRLRLENSLIPLIIVRSPRPVSVKAIQDFARKTGDLETLSWTDINLMALAYELECERNHGDWRLRSVPGQQRLNGAPPASLTENKISADDEECRVPNLSCPEATIGTEKAYVEEKAPIPKTTSMLLSSVIHQSLRDLSISDKSESKKDDKSKISKANIDAQTHNSNSKSSVISESEEEGWITSSNLKLKQERDSISVTSPAESTKYMQVALITTDFAIQNVLLRMNLNVLSLSLQRISNVRTWVLRCHACFQVSKNMTKEFCEFCGKPTLLRTVCTTNKDGKLKLHLKKNMQWNTRGNVFSIPKPRSGTSSGKPMAGAEKGGWGKSLILAEDQKEYVRFQASERRRKDRSLMDEDCLPDILTGHRRAGNRPNIGAGRNINSRKKK